MGALWQKKATRPPVFVDARRIKPIVVLTPGGERTLSVQARPWGSSAEWSPPTTYGAFRRAYIPYDRESVKAMTSESEVEDSGLASVVPPPLVKDEEDDSG
jgi:hypothetical protein